jgi:hypothetical protein
MRTFVKEQFLPDGVMRVGLTAECIKFLAIHAPEIIPNIPPLSEIKDKSKASSASKVIACMQVFWFYLQCFERSLCRLPVTLFEVVTMAHCVYALIIHFLWWGKPFTVEEPTTRVISGEKMSAILSYLWMSSAGSFWRDLPEFECIRFCPDMVDREVLPETVSFCHHSYNSTNTENSHQDNGTSLLPSPATNNIAPIVSASTSNTKRGSSDPASALEDCVAQVTPRTPASGFIRSQQLSFNDTTICKCCGISCSTSQGPHTKVRGQMSPSKATTGVSLFPGHYLAVTGFCPRPESSRFKEVDIFPYLEPVGLEKKIYLNRHDINRWSLASLAITKYGLSVPSAEDCNYVGLEISSLSAKPIPSEYQEQFLWKIAIINGLESVAYIIAWNYFPSADSSFAILIVLRGTILVSFTPLVLILSSFVISSLSHVIFRRPIPFEYLYVLTRYPPSGKRGSSSQVISFSAWLFATLCVMLYLMSKGVLVLVAVGDLFYLPDEAYQATTWSNYFPHIY